MTVAPSASAGQQPDYTEPALDLTNIQGNIVAGFKQDHQALLYVHIDDAGAFKPTVAKLGARVTTAEAVRTFNLLYKQLRGRGDPGSIRSTWMNIAFSFAGITKLITPRGDEVYFADEFFRKGAAASGGSKKWKVRDGDGGDAADVLIIVAVDTKADVDAELDVIKGLINEHGGATVLAHADVGQTWRGESTSVTATAFLSRGSAATPLRRRAIC